FKLLWFPDAGQTQCDAKLLTRYLDFPFAYDDVENTHSNDHDKLAPFIPHHKKLASAAAMQKACADGKFLDNNLLEGWSVAATAAPATIGVQFERADVGEVAVFTWRAGAWK